jgi:hypothetical protein
MKLAIKACQRALNEYLDDYEKLVGKMEARPEKEKLSEIEKVGYEWYWGEKYVMEGKIKELTRAIMYLKAVE